ncbi:IclR family transcriptional regulator [Cytobacillus sp.]|uniref:IclR family transcriptional regulator n=1 Tax=Cytobacillus sp. TaxID=2675269 RepID=UPI0028BF1E69|nr:IclR family transcriptional regulator [Cytobacillus sp.]
MLSSKTVSKALSILDAFTAEKPSWGLRDLARYLDMSHTIVHRILSTFEEKGYIVQNTETNKYELGIKFMELGNVVEENLKISEMIQPIMKRIALGTGESVVLTIVDNEEGLYLKIVESEKSVRFSESVGKRSPLYIGASHKVILAHLPPDIQNKIIDHGIENKARQIDTKESFQVLLEFIKKQGWFYTSSETFEEVAAVSIPLFDKKNNILGSLSVAGPDYRLTDEQAKKILPILKEYQENMNFILSKVFFPSRRNYLMNNLS